MTVPATPRRAGPFNGNGVTTSFPFSFKTFDEVDIAVVLVDADGLESSLVLNSDYSVTLNPDQEVAPGGAVTYPVSGTPLALGETLSIVGALPYDQVTDLPTGGSYRAVVQENAFDRTVMQIQQLAEIADRTLVMSPAVDPADVSTQLPPPEAFNVIGWNGGEPFALQNFDPATFATIVAFGTARADLFSGDGVKTVFVLTANPGVQANLDVAVDGITQRPGVDFIWSAGTTITFTSPPGAGTGNILARYQQGLPTEDSALRVDLADSVDAGLGDALVAVKQPFAGATARTQHDKNLESLSLAEFGVVGDGVTDDTLGFQNALNAAGGKKLTGVAGETYLIRDRLTVLSNTHLDLQGATMLDDVQTFRPPDQASRAEPLFYICGVSNVIVENFAYEAAPTRASVSNDVPTGIVWIGDNSTDSPDPTHDVEIANIQASNCADFTLFVGVVGEAYNLHIHDIDITGDCSYGINLEYGEAPTGTSDADAYGQHPHNVLIERFNGYDNQTSVGFLRVASCYNVKFSNCYGKDVRNYIWCWTGDRGISRVSQNVVYENCSHYASSTFAAGVVDYVVQVLAVNKDGSTSDPLPVWTNYNHLFRFVNCQFQGGSFTDSAALRFYGQKGCTVFESCIFRDSYYGLRAGPSSNPDYISEFSLTFNDCLFINNVRDVSLSSIQGVLFSHCKFKDATGALVPVRLESGASYNKFLGCHFTGLLADVAYIAAGAGLNEISQCIFSDVGTAPPLELSSVTLGRDNVFPAQGLTLGGWGYYGVRGEPTTLYESLANVPSTELDVYKRTQYVAETGAVVKTVSSLINGAIGDEVVVQSASVGASVTFSHLAGGVPTLERIFTPGGVNLTKTGTFWTVRLKLTPVGWILFE